MTLVMQFQVFLGSIFLGMLFSFLWSVFNRIFYKTRGKVIRFPIELLVFIGFAYCYFRFLVLICDGEINIHFFLAGAIGLVIYYRFYAHGVNLILENCAFLIEKRILKPVKLHFSKIKIILKKRINASREKRKAVRKKKNEKRDKKKNHHQHR